MNVPYEPARELRKILKTMRQFENPLDTDDSRNRGGDTFRPGSIGPAHNRANSAGAC